MVEGHRLARQDGRMAERVTQDQRPDPEPFGLAGEPRVGDHRFEHGLALRERRGEVIHARHAGEAGRLRGAGGSMSWSMVSRICGRNSQNSIGLGTVNSSSVVSRTRWVWCAPHPVTRGPEDIYGSPTGNNRSGPVPWRRHPERTDEEEHEGCP